MACIRSPATPIVIDWDDTQIEGSQTVVDVSIEFRMKRRETRIQFFLYTTE